MQFSVKNVQIVTRRSLKVWQLLSKILDPPCCSTNGISAERIFKIEKIKGFETGESHLVRRHPSCPTQALCWASRQPGALRPGARPPREGSNQAASVSCCKTEKPCNYIKTVLPVVWTHLCNCTSIVVVYSDSTVPMLGYTVIKMCLW